MEYKNDEQIFNFASGLLLGAVIGAGIALLTAPDAGRRTRRRIRRAAGDLRDDAEGHWEELSDEVRHRVDDALREAKQNFS